MKTAHKCKTCGRVSRNVAKVYDASSVCGTEVYICLAWKQCRKRLEARGVQVVEYAGMANPPKGSR